MVSGKTFSHYPAKRNNRVFSWRLALVLCALAVLAPKVNHLTTGKTQNQAHPVSLEAREVADNRDRLLETATQAIAEAERLKPALEISARLAAISKYSEAQRLWESAGEFGKAAEALCSVGDIYFSLSQYKEALSRYNAALTNAKRAGDQLLQFTALNGIAYMYANLGDNDLALRHAKKVLRTLEHLDRTKLPHAYARMKAQALNTIGEVHYARRELQESIAVFTRTIPLWREAEDRSGEALGHLNLGYSHGDLGELRKGSEKYELALDLFTAANDTRGMALAQTALGGALSILGETQTALELHKKARQYFQQTGNKQGEAASLNGIAGAYEDLGDYQSAIDQYTNALHLYEELGNRRLIALNKFVIGRALFRKGEPETAEKYCLESLSMSRALRDPVIEANVLQSLAAIYFARSETSRALSHVEAALVAYRKVGNHWSEAYALNDRGHFQISTGDLKAALASYEKALSIMRDVGDRQGEALTLVNLARLECNRSNLIAAQTLIEKSLAITEYLHQKIRNSQLRTSYFSYMHRQYEVYVHVLMQLERKFPEKGYAQKALLANESSRARSLRDSLREQKEGLRTKAGTPAANLVSEELQLLQALDESATQQVQLLARKHTEEEENKLSQQIRELNLKYQDVRAKLKEQDPHHATLIHTIELTAEKLQKIVGDDSTLLLEFAFGEKQSYLWVVSQTDIKSYELPERATIEALVRSVYELATVRQLAITEQNHPKIDAFRQTDSDYWRQAARLSTMLLGPMAAELGTKRLLIVADGLLHYFPFDALPEPGLEQVSTEPEPLFLKHEVIAIPSAMTLAALQAIDNRETISGKAIAVFADPVFEKNDPRVLNNSTALAQTGDDEIQLSLVLRNFTETDRLAKISRLPATLREAQAISAVIPHNESLITMGFAANKQQVLNESLKDFRILHFATHGLLNNDHPEFSGIILSLVDEHGNARNGFLRVNDIYQLDLTAELIVLSACRTGLGKEVRGEGIIGLPTAFMYAGAQSVVASVWKVDDEATAELMSHLYAGIFQEGLPPAAALRKAKEKMWRQERWHAPFYWGAFVFQGQYAQQIRIPPKSDAPAWAIPGGILMLSFGAAYAILRRLKKQRTSSAQVSLGRKANHYDEA